MHTALKEPLGWHGRKGEEKGCWRHSSGPDVLSLLLELPSRTTHGYCESRRPVRREAGWVGTAETFWK